MIKTLIQSSREIDLGKGPIGLDSQKSSGTSGTFTRTRGQGGARSGKVGSCEANNNRCGKCMYGESCSGRECGHVMYCNARP